MKNAWRWIERQLHLVELARAHATSLGDSCEVAWSIAALAADVETEARRFALLTDCLTRLRF